MESPFTTEQVEFLLRAINPNRVRQRQGAGRMQLSYLEGYEVRAHLTRVFGFGNWSVRTKVDIEYAEQRAGQRGEVWAVGARGWAQLLINTDTVPVVYEDVSFAENISPSRGDATDQAMKSAATDALKRAAVNLGDQFGLSLYRNGSVAPVVRNVSPWDPTQDIYYVDPDDDARDEADQAHAAAEGSQERGSEAQYEESGMDEFTNRGSGAFQ